MRKRKLIKNQCEIFGCEVVDPKLLQLHHIKERTELDSTNDPFNLAILCSLHHNMVHIGRIEIIDTFPSTKLPNNRTLVYRLDGKLNVDITQEYRKFSVPADRIPGE